MFKGNSAAPETIARRPYHRQYYLANKKNQRKRVPCPNCDKTMYEGREECSRCQWLYRRWDKCECDREKTKSAKRCHHCAGIATKARLKRIRAANLANPYCPNKFEGAGECETRRPHTHCGNCGWPTIPEQGLCHHCVAEIERGACMTRKESERFEATA